MIVYSQDVYCNEVWIYDDGKYSHEVEGMLCVNKACCTILPFLTTLPPPITLPPPTTLPQCQCPLDLYSDSLCPINGPCNKDPKAVTYGSPPLCPFTLNCEQTDYVRFQYADGTYTNNIRVRDFRQSADVQCVNGEWRYYGQAKYDTVLRNVVCYSVAIPLGLAGYFWYSAIHARVKVYGLANNAERRAEQNLACYCRFHATHISNKKVGKVIGKGSMLRKLVSKPRRRTIHCCFV
ncbi:unnamed protein product [Cylicocyclus nassatus]|uniref:Uncharacterized protein n=1 Tax=Cylicocyclus nassatus TaxID=53992 RepID=A0AA36GG08_CYLNA|nr:unnamed protein product [Cylicocyclus nassatus]